MISTPQYCPRCCDDAEMKKLDTHFAFVCPRGHIIAAIHYVVRKVA